MNSKQPQNQNLVWHAHTIQKGDRASRLNQKPFILWLTGLSGSGKSTIANALEKRLFDGGYKTYLLDGDNIRHGLNSDLGFCDSDRQENIRRVAETAKLFVDAGIIVICAFISPFAKEREFARNLVEKDEFVEIYIKAPIEICRQRDPKGLYAKAQNGEVKNFTGIDSGYEAPQNAELTIDTSEQTAAQSVSLVVDFLSKNYRMDFSC